MKKLLVIALIGSMALGISGCSGKVDSKGVSNNESVDMTKEEETTTEGEISIEDETPNENEVPIEDETPEEETTKEASKEETSEVTIKELIDIAKNTEYKKVCKRYESEMAMYFMIDGDTDMFYEVPAIYIENEIECINNGVTRIENEQGIDCDNDTYKKYLKKLYMDDIKENGEEWNEEEFEEIYELYIKEVEQTIKSVSYEVQKDDFFYIITYNDEEQRWETKKEEIENKLEESEQDYVVGNDIVDTWFEDAVLKKNEDGYIISSFVDDPEFLKDEFKDSLVEVEEGVIKFYFDKNKTFNRMVWEVECKEINEAEISEENDVFMKKFTMTMDYESDFNEDIKLPDGVVLE